MQKLKVLTVVGTRPEIIRLSEICKALDASDSIDHIFVNTGQNTAYELNQLFFDDLSLRAPDYSFDIQSDSTMGFIASMLPEIDTVLDKEAPDAFLILGDTNSGLAALAAKKRKIPIFHFEAGNRCFDQRVPEETNRKLIDNLADINLTYSSLAKENLLREGFPSDRVICIGSPMREVIEANKQKIENSNIVTKLGLKKKSYFLISFHRYENLYGTDSVSKFMDILDSLIEKYDVPVIVSTHPHTRKVFSEYNFDTDERISLLNPLSYTDYNHLQLHAKAVLSDSGTLSEEASILNFPAINLRETHERPEAMEEAAAILTGLNKKRIMQAIALLLSTQNGRQNSNLVKAYEPDNVSQKLVRLLVSYVDYVNRKVWNKRYE